MKIITMQRLTLDGKPVYPDDPIEKDWWCVIETEEEKLVYDMFVKNISSNIQSEELTRLWNTLVKHAGQDKGVSWGDDDVVGAAGRRRGGRGRGAWRGRGGPPAACSGKGRLHVDEAAEGGDSVDGASSGSLAASSGRGN